MKLSTTTLYRHSLFSPRGMKFGNDLTKDVIKEIIIISEDSEINVRELGSVIQWTDIHRNMNEDIPPEFWDEHINPFLVDIEDSNHYKWLEENLPKFWDQVFGKSLEETGCSGIISAHGDKCYQYRSKWKENNIPFYYGVAIYLLTYTTEFGDNQKHKSCEWVIDNYKNYLDKLPTIFKDNSLIENETEVKVIESLDFSLKEISKLEKIKGRTIKLTLKRNNSSRVVDGKVMIKGIGVFDKKYFVRVKHV